MTPGIPFCRAERGRAATAAVRLFLLLASYALLRPLRDELGVRFGVERLPWLFTATLAAMLVATPLFGLLAARLPRRRLAPALDLLFAAAFVGARFALASSWAPLAAPLFFVGLSVFNLSAVSLAWSVASDLFDRGGARRRYGWIAAGGSAGALAGPALASTLAPRLGIEALPLAAAGALALAALLPLRLGGDAQERAAVPAASGALAGVRRAFGSRYLLALTAMAACYPLLSTLLYLAQLEIVAATIADSAARVTLFARLDLAVNALTLLAQVTLTPALLARCGPGGALAAVSGLVAAGFVALALAPSLAMVAALQIVHRAGRFAVGRPARELLFVSLDADSRYPAKQFLDTAVYRASDAAGAWLQSALRAAGAGLSASAAIAVPVALFWTWGHWRLGRSWEARARTPALSCGGPS